MKPFKKLKKSLVLPIIFVFLGIMVIVFTLAIVDEVEFSGVVSIAGSVISSGGISGSSISSYLISDITGSCLVTGSEESGGFYPGAGFYNLARYESARWLTWYLAEGATLNDFDMWVLVQNPNDVTAQVEVTFMKSDGETVVENIEVEPTSRYTIYVNDIVPNEAVSTKVESTNGVSIMVERAMYRSTAGIDWACAHDSIGVTDTATTWYLAEGATLNGFDTWVLVQNPTDTAANVLVTFMKSNSETVEQNIVVGPTSRYTIHVNGVVPDESVSTKVESTNGVGIIVERAMYRSTDEIEWVSAHNSIGVTETSPIWYLAEGATVNDFDMWVLIQNPSYNTADVLVTFMKSNGETVDLNIQVGPTSRYTLYANDVVPEESISTKVESLNDVGIIVERAMYRSTSGIEWACAHNSIGVTQTATRWFLPEGATLNGFDEWVLIQNPNNSEANVNVTFMKSNGETVVRNIKIPATSRYTIYVNEVVPDESVSTEVESINNVGIIVERAMYRTTTSVSYGEMEWVCGHNSIGIAQ